MAVFSLTATPRPAEANLLRHIHYNRARRLFRLVEPLAAELRSSGMLIDAHVHLDKYGGLLDEALKEIEERRIFTVATAMDIPSFAELEKIAARSPLVLPTFGIHPRRAQQYASRMQDLAPLIERSPALGEIGLDFHWVKDRATYPAQLKILEYFFAAAREQNKFVNLHTKGGEKEILDLLEKYRVQRVIIHWYSGPLDILRAMIEYGAYFTIGVEAGHSAHIQAIAREIPDPLLLTETDNPGGLQWLTGAIGMPSAIERVVEALADLRQSTAERMERSVQTNFRRLVAGDPWLKSVELLCS